MTEDNEFNCALCGIPMRDPVTLLADGVDYERSVLELWLLGLESSREPDNTRIKPNACSPTTGRELNGGNVSEACEENIRLRDRSLTRDPKPNPKPNPNIGQDP